MEVTIRSSDPPQQIPIQGENGVSAMITLIPGMADVYSRFFNQTFKRHALDIITEAVMPDDARIHYLVPDVQHSPYGNIDVDSEPGQKILSAKVIPPTSLGYQSGYWTTLVNIVAARTVEFNRRIYIIDRVSLAPKDDVVVITFYVTSS